MKPSSAKAKGRNLKIQFSSVKIMAKKNNIPVLQPENINDENFYNTLKTYNPTIFIVVAYGKILPKKIIDLPLFGTLNIHASLLPKYRGASPINYTLLSGDKETGVTIMKMDEYMDTGPIVAKEKVKINRSDDFSSLHNKLAQKGADLLTSTLPFYFSYDIILKQGIIWI
jgi:methionyl-tRNA formyltransferase